jgi:hypothetical protein
MTSERLDEILKVQYWLNQYNLFTKAKNLGVNFGPTDLTIDQINYFTIIKEKIDDLDKDKKQ